MDISIIIPAYNAENTIRDCVTSILNSDFDNEFEVIVVDDGSTDQSAERIEDLNVSIVRSSNKGAAAARNAGARVAKSDLLLFVDSDVAFFKDTLRRLYEHLRKEDVHFVTPRYCRTPINQKRVHKYKALADYCYYYDLIFTEEQKKGPIRQVVLAGGTVGYKKSVFEQLGGFDENIKRADVELEELQSRLILNGYNMIGDGSITTRHNFPDFDRLMKSYFFRTMHAMEIILRNNYAQPYLRKNRLRTALAPLVVLSLLGSVILFVGLGYKLPLLLTPILFCGYFVANVKLLWLAFKVHGLIFAGYALLFNIFFSSVVTLGGFLGVLGNLRRKC